MSAVGQAALPADSEYFAVTGQPDRHDDAVTAQSADDLDRQRLPVGRLGNTRAVVEQGVEIDEHRHLRPHGSRSFSDVGGLAGEVIDDRVGLQLVPGPIIAVLVGGTGRGNGSVERRPHPGVSQRIQRQQRVAHPAVPVDPPPHLTLPPQPLMT